MTPSPRMLRSLGAALSLTLTLLIGAQACSRDEPGHDPDAVQLQIPFEGRDRRVSIEHVEEGYIFFLHGGEERTLTPDQFADLLYQQRLRSRERGLVFRIFNITTWWGVLWVSVGFLGQLMFTFRMVLQWLTSEKQHRSVVPVGFWWGSLWGGMMLLAYFIWRKDIVGIIGQSTGAVIYARNLWLIYFGSKRAGLESEVQQAAQQLHTDVPSAGNP